MDLLFISYNEERFINASNYSIRTLGTYQCFYLTRQHLCNLAAGNSWLAGVESTGRRVSKLQAHGASLVELACRKSCSQFRQPVDIQNESLEQFSE